MGLIIDNFAGGGGTSQGIKEALGRDVDIAINHDPDAIAMHKINHPHTKHYCEDVWNVDPIKATGGKPVDLAWFSPDCKHFSKAKPGKPKDKNIRGLAWVAVKWAYQTKPRIIILENVEEFKSWGPLGEDEQPDKSRMGETFSSFVETLKRRGYKVEWRELRACDYGAPTIRKRFFLIARCDGQPIVWLEPTHGEGSGLEPYRAAKDIIDWSIPCKSIFGRKKPLSENTMRRIHRGLFKFVINNPDPFLIPVNNVWDWFENQKIQELPYTGTGIHENGIATPYIVQTGQTGFADDRRSYSVNQPLTTIVTKAEHCIVTPFLSKYYGGNYKGAGSGMEKPVSTITTVDHNAMVSPVLIQMGYGDPEGKRALDIMKPLGTVTAGGNKFALAAAFIKKDYGTGTGQELKGPLHTVTAFSNHFSLVSAFLMKYYGNGIGQDMKEPMHTITAKDRFGLVAVQGINYQIVDIGMRMLAPRELFRAQGFPDSYVIDRDAQGQRFSKAKQVALCGNAVPPPFAKALVQANCGFMVRKKDIEEVS